MPMFGTDHMTYDVSMDTCPHCGERALAISISRLVMPVLNMWQTVVIPLHYDEARDFAQAISDTLVLSDMEEGIGQEGTSPAPD